MNDLCKGQLIYHLYPRYVCRKKNNMNLVQYVNHNQLKPADAIVLRKKFMGMVDHYAIYLGKNRLGTPEFVANFTKGVGVIPDDEIKDQMQKYIPQKIERFEGSTFERKSAIERASSRLGENAYGFFSNNCEHFKNWVHYGKQISEQVDKAGTVMTIGGTTMLVGGLLASNKKTRNWGAGILVAGVILKCLAERKEVKEN